MIINEIYLDGFRNFEDVSVQFSEGVNVIAGSNAQGKTNLIEAIYYIAAGRSFRPSSDKELISINSNYACIRADIISAEREQTIEAKLFRGRRRELYVNNVKLKTVSELAGRLTAVTFSPDDLNIIKEGAAVRRKMMDNCLSQLRPGYLSALMEFNRLYENKTRILRDYHEKPYLLDLLDDFNIRLVQQSARLIYYRSAFVKGLSRRAAEIHNEFSGNAEKLTINYKTVGGMNASEKKPEEILSVLTEHQQEHRQAEIKSGMCLSGAHKDDLEIDIDGAATRKYASQGQARTAAVSIKLAERDIHYEDRGEYPILLLDDVLSELDSKRQRFILERIINGQIFITCCDENITMSAPVGMMLRIENGKLG